MKPFTSLPTSPPRHRPLLAGAVAVAACATAAALGLTGATGTTGDQTSARALVEKSMLQYISIGEPAIADGQAKVEVRIAGRRCFFTLQRAENEPVYGWTVNEQSCDAPANQVPL